jgi:hexokinase
MREALKDLAIHCELVTAEDGSGIGAALVALVASKIGCATKA